jgi:hypothetical protein
MEQQEAAARLLSVEDVVLEILLRVATDAAALFRCAMACKRWCALVADRSLLSRCWPENALLGFVARQRVFRRLFFVPPPWAGSVLGGERRLLTSIVDGLRDSQSLKPLTARRGLLLVLLSSENLVLLRLRAWRRTEPS